MLDRDRIIRIEKSIDYTFKDKSLLTTAFTHSTYSYEHGGENNEKLEFLGDSILNFIVAERLYQDHLKTEGDMTIVRSKLVSRLPLAKAVDKLGLAEYLQIAGSFRESEKQSFRNGGGGNLS